jgi:hypothetical protein
VQPCGLMAGVALAAVTPNTPTPMPEVKAQMKDAVDKTSPGLFNTAATPTLPTVSGFLF